MTIIADTVDSAGIEGLSSIFKSVSGGISSLAQQFGISAGTAEWIGDIATPILGAVAGMAILNIGAGLISQGLGSLTSMQGLASLATVGSAIFAYMSGSKADPAARAKVAPSGPK